jgi:ADP-heptose:LPS heptosyltransferase
MMRIHLLKFLDRWLGTTLARLLPRPAAPSPIGPDPQSILIIRPGGIGDAVLLVPTINALRAQFPRAAIDLLAERRNAGVFALCPEIRSLFCYDRPGQLLEVLRRRYTVVIDSEQWHYLSAVIARLVRAPVKIGFATNPRRRLFTSPVAYSHDDYEVASFLRLLYPLGISGATAPVGPWLQVPDYARQAADSLLPEDDWPLAVIFPGASITERCWGVEKFARVADWFRERRLRVVVVGGEGERADGEILATSCGAINLAGKTSLAETAALLARSTVLVSGDTGILHLAVGLGCPTVSLFGPGIAAKWAPQGAGHIVLNKKLHCSPCTRFGYTPDCPHGVRCMREIAVADVTEELAGFCPSA